MTFDRARAIADTVLLEGYVLYPYRASSTKNRCRWTFGALGPKTWSESPAGSDPWWMQTECVIEPNRGSELRIEGLLRFLQLQDRSVEARTRDARTGRAQYEAVARLSAGDELVVPWEEGVVREISLGPYRPTLDEEECEVVFGVPGGREESPVGDAGRIVRRTWQLQGRVHLRIARDGQVARLRLRVENHSDFDASSERERQPNTQEALRRDKALRRGLLSTHVLLRVWGGRFASLLDPPDHARDAVSRCDNVHLYPVLAGEQGQHDLVLASPIILYDHPQIAPESTGDFFDSTEIDELLTLRTATLTEDEKRQARATDARAAAIVDRVDHLPPEMMDRLHGAIRELAPEEREQGSAGLDELEEIPSSGCTFSRGKRVRLCPSTRRTDAQDLLFVGRTATIRRVLEDVDGNTWLAVTLDDDPAAEINDWYGRFRYYYTDEVELLDESAA